jgi:hypothetical protein
LAMSHQSADCKETETKNPTILTKVHDIKAFSVSCVPTFHHSSSPAWQQGGRWLLYPNKNIRYIQFHPAHSAFPDVQVSKGPGSQGFRHSEAKGPSGRLQMQSKGLRYPREPRSPGAQVPRCPGAQVPRPQGAKVLRHLGAQPGAQVPWPSPATLEARSSGAQSSGAQAPGTLVW